MPLRAVQNHVRLFDKTFGWDDCSLIGIGTWWNGAIANFLSSVFSALENQILQPMNGCRDLEWHGGLFAVAILRASREEQLLIYSTIMRHAVRCKLVGLQVRPAILSNSSRICTIFVYRRFCNNVGVVSIITCLVLYPTTRSETKTIKRHCRDANECYNATYK